MALTALVVAVLALLLALSARAKAASFATRLEDLERDSRRRAENVADELSEELKATRRHLAALAKGGSLDEEQIMEGRLWRDVNGREGQALYDAGDLRVVDVRTGGEVAGGMIPGALHIPIDELEARRDEIARDGKTTLFYCAGGGRSAAACEYLSSEGWTNLLNLEGGFGSWTGSVERPS